MKIPNEIATLAEFRRWVDENSPKTIVIGPKSKIKRIKEFDNTWEGQLIGNVGGGFTSFMGIPVNYLKYDNNNNNSLAYKFTKFISRISFGQRWWSDDKPAKREDWGHPKEPDTSGGDTKTNTKRHYRKTKSNYNGGKE